MLSDMVGAECGVAFVEICGVGYQPGVFHPHYPVLQISLRVFPECGPAIRNAEATHGVDRESARAATATVRVLLPHETSVFIAHAVASSADTRLLWAHLLVTGDSDSDGPDPGSAP